jgi:hypothetical protein
MVGQCGPQRQPGPLYLSRLKASHLQCGSPLVLKMVGLQFLLMENGLALWINMPRALFDAQWYLHAQNL